MLLFKHNGIFKILSQEKSLGTPINNLFIVCP